MFKMIYNSFLPLVKTIFVALWKDLIIFWCNEGKSCCFNRINVQETLTVIDVTL